MYNRGTGSFVCPHVDITFHRHVRSAHIELYIQTMFKHSFVNAQFITHTISQINIPNSSSTALNMHLLSRSTSRHTSHTTIHSETIPRNPSTSALFGSRAQTVNHPARRRKWRPNSSVSLYKINWRITHNTGAYTP